MESVHISITIHLNFILLFFFLHSHVFIASSKHFSRNNDFPVLFHRGIIIAPTTSQYLPQAWRGAAVLSLVWFLHRWKTNVFTRAMEKPAAVGLDRDKLLTLEKISSMGLLVLGAIALAEACGVAVQSILTVGGIGGNS